MQLTTNNIKEFIGELISIKNNSVCRLRLKPHQVCSVYSMKDNVLVHEENYWRYTSIDYNNELRNKVWLLVKCEDDIINGNTITYAILQSSCKKRYTIKIMPSFLELCKS